MASSKPGWAADSFFSFFQLNPDFPQTFPCFLQFSLFPHFPKDFLALVLKNNLQKYGSEVKSFVICKTMICDVK
jgi:hypothetical protein